MSSLWTPSGEHRPPDEPDPPRGGAQDAEPALDEEQLREALARLAATPVAAIVADHVVRLHELAVLHLGLASERPESFGEAALAIDAVAALVEGLGDRLGDAAAPLADALAQLRLAFVQVRSERASGDAPGPPSGAGSGAAAEAAPEPSA